MDTDQLSCWFVGILRAGLRGLIASMVWLQILITVIMISDMMMIVVLVVGGFQNTERLFFCFFFLEKWNFFFCSWQLFSFIIQVFLAFVAHTGNQVTTSFMQCRTIPVKKEKHLKHYLFYYVGVAHWRRQWEFCSCVMVSKSLLTTREHFGIHSQSKWQQFLVGLQSWVQFQFSLSFLKSLRGSSKRYYFFFLLFLLLLKLYLILPH